MELKSTNKVDTNRYELDIVVDGEVYAKAVDQATRKGMMSITVPGFRKGHAPRKMVEKMYGENIFLNDALEIVYPDAVNEAIEKSGLDLAEQKVDFEPVDINKDSANFKITVTTKPEVKLGDYKGLKADRTIVSVTDDEVESELKNLREKEARIVTVEGRAAQTGDTAVIDFEGFVDDKAFEGGKGESYDLELGSNTFIPGFEDQIVGHSTGDEFDVTVTFPKDYQAEELADKEAVFKVKVHEIKAKEYPEMDDEFAKDVSEFDTMDTLKKDLSDKILEAKNSRADSEVENALIEQIVDAMTAEVPDCMIDNRIDENIQDFTRRLQYQGLDIKTYMQYTGMDEAGFRNTFREAAEKQVKTRLALEAIAKLEKFEVTEDELNDEYKKIADMYQVEIDKVKTAIPEKGIREDVAVSKAVDLVKSSAVITNVEPAAEKPAAKKPAAKKAPAKKAAAKKADVADEGEKAPAKKTAAKKPAAKKPAAKKAAASDDKAE